MEPVSNKELQLAFDFVRFTNRNIFLTGKAGTGKTTFLHQLKKSLPKRMVVLAPTGVAAINAGGVTIHSFFQLPFHPFVPALYIKGFSPPAEEQYTYKLNREKINIIKSLDLLVIDEISMVRADLLDAIDSSLRRYKNRELPFGGVQLLMIGDLQQLAPVAKSEDMEILGKYYTELFFFGSNALKSTDYITIELKHIFRQSDQVFIGLLNKVRENRVDQMVLNELNKRHIPDFDPDSGGGYITLTTHNHQASSLNDSKLEKLPGKIHSFKASVRDDFPETSYPNVSELVLKKGAQVMFVKNDISKEKRFFNGKLGKVEAFDEDSIVVRCPGDNEPIIVEMMEWQNVKFSLDDNTKEIQETVIGTFTQYPLKLAWAITIHKSQGLTFDRAVIDAQAAFAHGQVYVALSRCRTLEGLVLSTRIDHRCIVDNPSVTDFIRQTEKNQPGQKELEESKKTYQRMLLGELFSFNILIKNINTCVKILKEHQESFVGNPETELEAVLQVINKDIVEVAEKFKPHIDHFLRDNPDAESNAALQERIRKAGEYFSTRLEAALHNVITDFAPDTDNKAARKVLNDALDRLRKESMIKLACLNEARSGFKISSYLDTKAKSAIERTPTRTRQSKTEYSSGTSNRELVKLLKEWRSEKAGKIGLPEYMILPHKTIITLAETTPASMKALRKIKGIGKKKAEKYGEELLEIISSYCTRANIEMPAETPEEEKKEKKVKPDSKKVTYDLFREGKTILQIAEHRDLSVTTIEQHLSQYVGKGMISVNELVPQDIMDLILPHLFDSEDLRLGPAKETLGEKVTWGQLRFVASHIKFIRTSR